MAIDPTINTLADENALLNKVMAETAAELGCEPDNEVILQAISDLQARAEKAEHERDELKHALKWAATKVYQAWEIDGEPGSGDSRGNLNKAMQLAGLERGES